MFVACGIWCLADVSSVSPSSEQTAIYKSVNASFDLRTCIKFNLELHNSFDC